MSFSALPQELLDAVAGNLEPCNLASFARVSSFCHPVAQRLLYRNLIIAPQLHNYSVVFTLVKKPALARHVRSFRITIQSDTPLFRAFYRQLAVALSLMTELTALDVFVPEKTSWMLQASQTPRLHHFASSFSFDSHVARFIEHTARLRELELDSIIPHTTPVNPLVVPNLAHFVGSSQLAELIVPGRPIESIHLTSGDCTNTTIDALAASTATVTVLGASTSSPPLPLLERLSKSVPHLVYLRVMSTYNFSEAPDVLFYENIAHALAALPHLQAFELSGMHWNSRKHDEERVWQSKPLNVDIGTEEPNSPEDNALENDVASDLFYQY